MKYFGILLLAIISIAQSTYFTKQNIKSGIAFIRETNGSLSYQKWNALYYYDIKSYLDQVVLFENAIKEMRRACKFLLDDNMLCTTLIIRLEKYREKLERTKSIIDRFRMKGRHRQTSFNGSASYRNFEFINEQHDEIYNDIIDKLEGNLTSQQELNGEYLTIFRGTLILSDNWYRELNNKIIFLNSHAVAVMKSASNNEVGKNFDFLLELATLIMTEHNRVSDIIVDLLTDMSIQEITTLLPPKKLLEDLKPIGHILDAEKQLPIDLNTEDIFELLKMSMVKTTIVNNRLFIMITIPIVNTISYGLYRAIPIPTRVDNEIVTIQPSTDYFFMNENKSQYIPISVGEYAKCARKSNNQVICNPSSPIFVGQHSGCEIALLNKMNIKDLQFLCGRNIKKIAQRNYFIKMGSPNIFYVFINKPITVRFLCDGREPAEVLIDQNGMLTLNEKCVMNSEDIEIKASYETGFESKYLLEFPELNISDLIKMKRMKFSLENKSKDEKEQDGDISLPGNYDNGFDDLKERVERIREWEREFLLNENEPKFESSLFNGVSWFKTIYISIAIVLSIMLITKIITILCHCILHGWPWENNA